MDFGGIFGVLFIMFFFFILELKLFMKVERGDFLLFVLKWVREDDVSDDDK